MDWQAFRTHFPVTDQWCFLDHAAVAPLSRPATEAMHAYAADLAGNGVVHFRRWEARVEQVRALAARLLGAEGRDIAFVANTTAGIGNVAEGFPWRPGENVVTAAEEYPSNQYPWMNLASRGVEVRAIASRGCRIDLDDLVSAMDDRTRLVSISAVEFASGYRNDLAAIGDICRRRNIFFFVDAIQGLGVLPCDVGQLPVDGLAADGHKWMLGPEGAGIFWLRREWLDRLHTIGVGWNSVVGSHDFNTIDLRLKPNAGRWEGGSYNVAGITALGASLELLLDAGIATIWERVRGLTDHLCDQAARVGLEVFSSRLDAEKSGIVSLVHPRQPAQALKQRCEEAGIVINVRRGRMRISPHAYNTFDEMDRFIDCVK